MELRFPAYYSRFSCIQGRCPDTCCHDWDVVLDDASAAFYRTVPGELGQILRGAMVSRDGQTCLHLIDGRCPLLDGDGLCRIQRAYGPEQLSPTCDLHPRFAEEYGGLREWSLSMGCPEAARLLLAQSEPTTFYEEQTPEPPGLNDLDARLFFGLLAVRKAAFTIAQDRSRPWPVRRGRLLALGETVQRKLDQHRISQLEAVAARFARFQDGPDAPDDMDAFWPLLSRLEPINGQWQTRLHAAADGGAQAAFEAAYPALETEREHLTVYYLYRYLLKAVVDRRVRARMALAIRSADAVGRLELAVWRAAGRLSLEDRVDCIHRYSREVEHAPTNLAALLAALS